MNLPKLEKWVIDQTMLLFFLIFTALFTSVYAEKHYFTFEPREVIVEAEPVPEPVPVATPSNPHEVLIEAKASYFYPTSHHFREIYGNGGGLYGLEVSYQAWKNYYVWVSASYFSQTGSSIGCDLHTRIKFVPIGAGVKYLYNINEKLDAYVGIGGLATYLHTKDDDIVSPVTSKWGGGGIVKAGILVNLTRGFFLDFFGDYSYIYIPAPSDECVETRSAHLSGVSAGAALGYRF